ncbi:flagellar hook-associated protein FlgL [Amphritea balenae]|uniref:Flagellar hook-associated protein 3 n=1 Tax=Amphritea balenae TaxID=452629 RepID=A0A3P1SQK2_9GAMM|nr:flagellar hook-associated protein FlgL [Amphritea balenae]RRC99254.1 flagellar hook-associated protein 3 [Amphritea balenae]GGK72700.1 flagellar hook-associated protein FlgL [Amphritea balenae]
MRISTQQQYLQSIDNMQQSQVKLARLQDEISTGKKLINPSDDPVAAARVVKLERELAQYEKFDENINVTERRLELEEVILGDVNSVVDRMRELAIQSGGAILTNSDRAIIAQEMGPLMDHLANLMNTQDAEGEYIFSGSKGTTKPYPQQVDGKYLYQGDDGQRDIQVGSELFIPSNDSGQQLFESVQQSLNVELTGLAVYNANVAATDPFMRNTAFASTEAEERYKDAVQGLGDLTITVTEPVANSFEYSITDSGGNPVLDEDGNPITNIPAGDLSTTPLDIDLHGMTFELHEPVDVINANQITFRVTPETGNILDAAQAFIDTLNTPVEGGDRTALNEGVAKALDEFKIVANRVVETQASLGSRMSSAEQVRDANLDFKLLTEISISELVDADLAEVVSKFSLQQATLQATQATFGQVSQLSLFDYIR